MNFINHYLKKNVFFYRKGKITTLGEPNIQIPEHSFKSKTLCWIVVAREHYQELDKSYPVGDLKEVKAIIQNEFLSLTMSHLQADDLSSTSAKIFAFDEVIQKFVENNACIFIPETLLAPSFLEDDALTSVDRNDENILLFKRGEKVFSSAGTGIYQNPEMFLLSAGVGAVNSKHHITQDNYFGLLLDSFFKLNMGELKTIFSSQIIHRTIADRMSFPSLAFGALLSVSVYWLAIFGNVFWLENITLAKSSPEEIKPIIEARKALSEKQIIINNKMNTTHSDMSGYNAWQLVVQLLEKSISVGSVIYEKNEIKLGLLAESSAETIEFLRGLNGIRSVVLDGDVVDWGGGKKQFVVVVSFEMESSHA